MLGGQTRVVLATLFCVIGLACLLHASAFSLVQQGQAAVHDQLLQEPLCRGLGRKAVDWWVMLKHPAGYQYSYLDSSFMGNSSTAGACGGGSCWRHRLSMLNPNPVAHTLAPLAVAAVSIGNRSKPAAQLAYVLYNDADPAGIEHFDFAHAKGVAAFSVSSSNDSYIGFWMVHSAPRFPQQPAVPGFDQLAKAQSVFGQHFSCFSIAGSGSINAVAELLLAAGPYVYNSSLPASFAAAFPAWQLLLSGYDSKQQQSVSVSFVTVAQQQLKAFAKTKYLAEVLTDDIVGPGLGVNMVWETWRRSHDALASKCNFTAGQVSSVNVQWVAFPSSPYRWSWSADHSKWGVSIGHVSSNGDGSGYVVCLGDMNRAAWQVHRGGGFVCMQHMGLWQAFSSIVAAVEPCP